MILALEMELMFIMGKIIIIASGKGGVGKTTVTAQLGIALSARGKRVLVSDIDFGLRNLDIVLGAESSVVYDVLDCVDGRCTLDETVIKINDNLLLLPASQSRRLKYVDMNKVSGFISSVSEKFDYILLDAPAGVGEALEKCAVCADEAFIIVRPYLSSVRDADRCIDVLEENGVEKASLIINDADGALIKSGVMMTPDSIADLLGIQVLGIVPHDESVLTGAGLSEGSIAAKAFSNISGRMLGEKIPVVSLDEKKGGFGSRIKKLLKFK